MPGQHAKLSPSSADRWISCPASIRMTEEYAPPRDEDGGPAALQGTIAHALGELEAGHTFGLRTRQEYLAGMKEWRVWFDKQGYPESDLKEMQDHVREYVKFIAQRLKRSPGSFVRLEQKLDTGVPFSWGTSDVVIVGLKHIEIIDLKYGVGVSVDAAENSQLRLYGLGALDHYGDLLDDTEEVYMTVFQPRLDSISTEVLAADELRKWRDEVVIPKALESQSPNASFGPSEKACMWCPVKGICRVRMDWAVQEDFAPTAEDPAFKQPEVLTPEELSVLLERIDAIKSWASSVETFAHDAMRRQGKQIPGWKVVLSAGKRGISDHEGIIKALVAMGKSEETISTRKALGIGELEKLVGKADFKEKLEQYVSKGTSKEVVVPEADKRDAVTATTSAAEDFGE